MELLREIKFLGYSLLILLMGCSTEPGLVQLKKSDRIVLIGNNLGSRMIEFGHFDTELHTRYPDSLLFIRNMCNPGNTPGLRIHSSRNSPWAFPGAREMRSEYDVEIGTEGTFPTEDEWLKMLAPDILLCFFGFNESFEGEVGAEKFEKELLAFVEHSKNQKYNGKLPPELILISPIAFESKSKGDRFLDDDKINQNLKVYTDVMRTVSKKSNVGFVDVYTPSLRWFDRSWGTKYTIDGSQLNSEGYKKLSEYLVDKLFGKAIKKAGHREEAINRAVLEKDWMWLNDFKIPNGVHVYGRRYKPFGPDNYPFEIEKIRQMTAIRDEAVWSAAQGRDFDIAERDASTKTLPEVESNYSFDADNPPRYLYGEEALDKFQLADGFKVELFASEKEFPDLANPMQISFDTKGRLWVLTMPSYPHWKAGDSRPDDKIIILEDTNGDGKADKQTVFADGLHLPIGFEFADKGVYVSQGRNMVFLKDTDGDDVADIREVILSGFDDHDTHHAHSVYTMDPSGAIYMAEGIFLHSNIETSHGTVRATNGGFFRYSPQNKKLERVAQMSILNPWGLAFDAWGQAIFTETSSPDVRWMLPGTIKPRYGEATRKSFNLIEEDHQVRPTSGLEFISSRHFPDEFQGDFLINNTIGFLGTKQHSLQDDGTGYHSTFRQDLIWSEDKNFRPVDCEFAPDGSLYLVDWHNMLIGHMQHNSRDPLRDHVHGRIYRITYPSRPLVKPAVIENATVDELLENLKLPEYRTRHRTKIELRTRDKKKVLSKTREWVHKLDTEEDNYEHNLLEGLWVTWGANSIDEEILDQALKAKDFRVRAAAVHALRFNTDQIKGYKELFTQAAKDPHGRVRLEVIAAASWLEPDEGLAILQEVGRYPLDEWMRPAYETAEAYLSNRSVKEKKGSLYKNEELTGEIKEQYNRGAVIFSRDGSCVTCHQTDGKGLKISGFPPLSGTRWVNGNEDRLIKLTLKGLHGPIEVLGEKYPGQVPMTPFEGMLSDDEIADVLTFVRNSFGNKSSAISPERVSHIREHIKDKKGFYKPSELLEEHPITD